MAIYSVMVPREETGSIATADRTIFVADRFNFVAAALGPLWLVYQRNWRGLFAWILFATIVVLIVIAGSLPFDAIFSSLLAVALFLGLQAHALVEAALLRRGYHLAGIVTGQTPAEAERIFFRRSPQSDDDPSATATKTAIYSGEPVLGLFPFPEARS